MRAPTKRIVEELIRIKREGRKPLSPHTVIRAARPKGSMLHRFFEWDDTKAARAYRVEQARELIQLAIVVHPAIGPTRVFVSLRAARGFNGSYREMDEIIRRPELRRMMLNDALLDIEGLRVRYAILNELRPIWNAVAAIRESIKTKKIAS